MKHLKSDSLEYKRKLAIIIQREKKEERLILGTNSIKNVEDCSTITDKPLTARSLYNKQRMTLLRNETEKAKREEERTREVIELVKKKEKEEESEYYGGYIIKNIFIFRRIKLSFTKYINY